jgi:hypothetical protein
VPDDALGVDDILICNLVGADEGIWDGSQQPPWRITWTVPAHVSVALGLAECLADIAVPYDLT